MDAKEVHKDSKALSLTILDLEDLLAIKYPDLLFRFVLETRTISHKNFFH